MLHLLWYIIVCLIAGFVAKSVMHNQAMKKLIVLSYAFSLLATTFLSACANEQGTTTATTAPREQAVTSDFYDRVNRTGGAATDAQAAHARGN
jgi:hypothetical protein